MNWLHRLWHRLTRYTLNEDGTISLKFWIHDDTLIVDLVVTGGQFRVSTNFPLSDADVRKIRAVINGYDATRRQHREEA